jgi:hypothetical protein
MKRYFLMTICGLSLLSFCGRANAQAPVPGQPYQIPAGYEGYPAGTVITYVDYNYVILSDTTMVLAEQATDYSPPSDDPGNVQVYQVPAGYEGYAIGTVISYGGANYTIGLNGTIVLTDQGYDQVYQVPAGYGGYAAGTVISYGGANYTIGLYGTMTLVTRNTYSSRYVTPGGPTRPGPNGGLTQNYHTRPGGYRPGPNRGLAQNYARPGAYRPGPNPGLAQNHYSRPGGYLPGPSPGFPQSSVRPGGGYRPPMNVRQPGRMGPSGGFRRGR